MSLLIDSHVHVYPSYDADVLFRSFRDATLRAGADAGAICLVEREGQSVFASWSRGEDLPSGAEVSRREDAALLLSWREGPPVAVLAGRQIACAERVEILALGTPETFRDGVPAAEAVAAARDVGALPVLAWGVGKWLFARAKVVDGLLRRFHADELFVGDTSMRPVFWPTPPRMSQAPSLGRRVLHGSDPLPKPGEEKRAGQWADLADDILPDDRPLASALLSTLREAPLRPVGRRAGLFEFVLRMR